MRVDLRWKRTKPESRSVCTINRVIFLEKKGKCMEAAMSILNEREMKCICRIQLVNSFCVLECDIN